MIKKWMKLILITISLTLLTACATVEEKTEKAIEAAQEEFLYPSVEANNDINNIKLYKPANFMISDESDDQNIVFSKNGDAYILFVNPNEASDSRLYFDLLKNSEKTIIAEKTFENEDHFGFIAATKTDNDKLVEVIVSIGGIKMTTLSKSNDIEENVKIMMQIVRSVELTK